MYWNVIGGALRDNGDVRNKTKFDSLRNKMCINFGMYEVYFVSIRIVFFHAQF
jgi:hypothetical protein